MDYSVRRLRKEDLTERYFEILSDLTVAPYPERTELIKRYEYVEKHPETYAIFVVVSSSGTLVGTGTLLIEHKFIHNLGKVGHIEDICISKEHQGKGLGKLLINHLLNYSREQNCYKVVLACSDKNKEFYEKCGLTEKEIEMAKYNTLE
ncbi:glucosamine-phosphate N-acetyltransferase [Nematocida sp. AWRm80]|nr:glucosamine-phosphate N-acetyltransferase [Nematocida sp. AWRm80]